VRQRIRRYAAVGVVATVVDVTVFLVAHAVFDQLVSADIIALVLAALTSQYPDLRKQIFTDEGKARSFVNVYLNDEDIRYLNKEQTPVGATDTMSIVPSVAGGSGEVRS